MKAERFRVSQPVIFLAGFLLSGWLQADEILKKVVIDPTVAIVDSMFRHSTGNLHPSFAIAVGKQADMVLLPGNPLPDINAIRKAKTVFKGNRVWQPARLYDAVGVKPFQ